MSNTKVSLPVQIALVPSYAKPRIRGASDAPGGTMTMECESVEHARQIMKAYPNAVMPSWRNPRAVWNQ